MTYDERLTQVESKVDEVLAIVRPKEAKTEPDPNQMIMDELGGISNEVDMLIDKVESVRKDVQTAIEQPFELTEELTEADKKFNKRRNIYVITSLLVTGGMTLIFWLNFLPLFSIAVGLFLSSGILALLLVKDEFVLPGNTIKRIAQNAIASAIFILGFVILIGIGIWVGNSLITDRSQSEEYKAPTATERTVERANTGDTEE
ncbi:MAG: hypothetical protein M9949_04685 [Candidatus Kapabacteria bacterium]|nr:hypothetical protein [Candidatus Kapabacteria bacterium]